MQLLKKIVLSFYKPFVAKKIYRTSIYKWEDIILHIPPGVFHPRYFFSTKFLLEIIRRLDLKNQILLELGAGSGLISIACAKAGAIVTSTDISKRVIQALHENAKRNAVHLEIIESDLFDALPNKQFDIIAINPPYYPKDPRNELEQAWYCGSDYAYFEKLFMQLADHIHDRTIVIMVLSEDCNLDRIFAIAHKNHFIFKERTKQKFWWELNLIYNVERVEGK